MPAIETLKLLKEQLSEQISGFDSSRRFYRDANFYLTLSTAALSASTTALIGAKEVTQAAWLTIAALVCRATVTVAAAYDGFLRSKDLWISNNETLTSLKALNATIAYAETKAAEPLRQTEVDEFYKSFEAIIGKANSSWEAFRHKAGANA